MKKIIGITLFTFLLASCSKPPADIDQFFYIPWPSDTRLADGGNVLSSGLDTPYEYPGARSGFSFDIFRLLSHHVLYRQGAQKMDEQKFGVNSGIFFTFEQAINSNNLPYDPVTTTYPTSPVQLINLNSGSTRFHESIPLRLDFKSRGTRQRPANALTLLPYQGYILEYDSQYAAIVFKDLGNSDGTALEAKQLYKDIAQPWDSSMQITQSQHALWQSHQALVADYVESTGRSMDDVAAFTVFTTQDPTAITLELRDALHTLTDHDIIDLVTLDPAGSANNPMLEPGSCEQDGTGPGWISMALQVKLPRWQRGKFPYFLTGGRTRFSYQDGKIVIPDEHELVPVMVAVPCDASGGPHPYIVSQDGNFSTATNAIDFGMFLLDDADNGSSDVLIIGAGDLIAGRDRRDDPGIKKALDLVNSLGLDYLSDETDALPAMRNGYTNAVAARGNMRQAATESYLLKRVAENLETIATQAFSESDLNSRGLSLQNFRVDKNNRVGLIGFSQGANNGMVNMAMDQHYDFAYFGSGVGIDLPFVTYAPGVKLLIETLFSNLETDELDLFHPISSFVQMGFEAMDSSNYVDHVSPTNILITAGSFDSSVPAQSTEHLALALARKGMIQAVAGTTGIHLDVPGYEDVLGLSPAYTFPISRNIMQGEGTGVYSYAAHGHRTCGDIGGFLWSATRGGPATLSFPCQ